MFAIVLAVALLNPDEVLATVNGVAITRREVQAALRDAERRAYDDAADDLAEVEHTAVRDYVGRQCMAAQAKAQNTTLDAIYARELATDYAHFAPNYRNRIEQQRERIYNAERSALDDVINARLLEAKVTDVAPVTQADIDFIIAYEKNKQKAAEGLPPGPQRLEAAIRAARQDALLNRVRSSATIELKLTPPRVDVSTANAPVIGKVDAPVKVVVFTDFECPYCKESEPALVRLKQKYGDKLAIFYRSYPLPNHLYAQPAAAAAICAGEQGKYFAMHDVLFAKQSELAHADYDAWATSLGVDRARFDQCIASTMPSKQIMSDIRDAVAAGVSGTPSFFVNGRLVRDLDHLSSVVAEEANR